MVEYRSKLLNRTFGALADPTRRRILAQLAKGEECVTDLARPHAMSLAAVSKHLIVLEKAGPVSYTHLDVYKRQAILFSQRMLAAAGRQ